MVTLSHKQKYLRLVSPKPSVHREHMSGAVPTAFEWAEYVKLKEQTERRRVQTKEYCREKRAQEKIAAGLDPNLNKRAYKREGESQEGYEKRVKRNTEKAQKDREKREGVWAPRKKLTPEEKKAKNAARSKAWRLAKRRQEAMGAGGA